MRVDVSLKNLEKSEFLDNVLAHDLEKIEKRVKLFRKDSPIHIVVRLEKSPHREEYMCSAHIYLPQHVLRADETKDSAPLAINKTFAALTKQLDKLKHKVETHLNRRRESNYELQD